MWRVHGERACGAEEVTPKQEVYAKLDHGSP